MAIQFARIEIVTRSSGGNACCKAAYNARIIITDQQTNAIYNFAGRRDNVYHTVLLPDYVDQKFKNPSVLMNEVEYAEKRKNSQLLKDVVIALPDDKELDLQDRIAITHEIIEEMAWVKNGLGVQVDIHKPHKGERNWHAHVLVTTRRFAEDGKSLGAKAADLNPKFAKVKGKAFIIPESQMIHERAKEVVNRYFTKLGLSNRVDQVSIVPQQHVGPTRMRSAINEIAEQNEILKLAHLEIIKSADGVLNRIIHYQAIFTIQDIEKATKDIDDEKIRDKLIQEVLTSDRLVKLYYEDGKDTKYYTTVDVREEELRILRIADKINSQIQQAHFNNFSNNNFNNFTNNIINVKDDIDKLADINPAQREALKHILINSQGIRVLQGRAGTGKSHVLATAYRLATSYRQNVIGLAPTHKAASELKSKGYQESYTVKGFLFKLYNGKAKLPNGSLIVVDEAGMVGHSDYLELLKVARSNNCNVILAGDDRQLTSIERGGMFEVFASKFGSYELSDVRRQNKQWAKEMALCFAKSDIAGGLMLLEHNNCLKADYVLALSVSRLINDWNNSKFDLHQRLIITVRNEEVDNLNQEIRKLLKANGILTGKEYRRYISAKKYEDYQAGDRILFKTTDKKLQIENGEFATLTSVSNDKFIAKTDQGIEIEFNPGQISFKHGYASTVYKAQGASIKDVYVLHNLAGNTRNSYVAMTRHVEEVKLYYNKESSKNILSLIYQLARTDHRAASVNFKTSEDLVKFQENKNHGHSITTKVGGFFRSIAEDIGDRLHNNESYYQPKIEPEPPVKVVEVKSTSTNLATSQKQEKLKTTPQTFQNDNQQDLSTSVKSKEEIKGGIMANYQNKIDYSANKANNKQELLELKQRLSFKAEEIGKNLLGNPNKSLSSSQILRWEKDGKIAMKIQGSNAGIWYDFSKGEGGDLFTLAQRERNYNFVQAKKYLQEIAGIQSSKDLRTNLAQKNTNQKQQYDEVAKIKRAEQLYEQSDSIKHLMQDTIAKKYLLEHRNIKEVLIKYQLSQDLRTNMMWDNSSKQYYPAIVAFVRDKQGNIAGGQAIYLNKETGAKADIEVNKRSFGKIRGSFVEISKNNGQKNEQENTQDINKSNNGSNVTIIAEGVETALSIQEAGIKGKILCSLGVHNIRNYQPSNGEKILIAADNDGKEAVSVNTVIKAKEELESKGAVVSIIMPSEKGDFNDMLKSKGGESIKKLIEPEITKLIEDKIEKLTTNQDATKFDESLKLESLKMKSLKSIDNSSSQTKSTKSLFSNSQLSNNDNKLKDATIPENLQQQTQLLARFDTEEAINAALQIYQEKGIDSYIYSNKVCMEAIEKKIDSDLQIMKNKFDPNYNLGNSKFSDIVVYDFKGKSHAVPEEYLAAIGRDKQIMQYINSSSEIGKAIRNELKQVSEIKQSQGMRVKM